MFDDDDEDVIELSTNAHRSQRAVMSPEAAKNEEVMFVDVEGTPSETESPVVGMKRKAESPPILTVPQVVTVSVPTIRSALQEDDSNPVKLKIKVSIILS